MSGGAFERVAVYNNTGSKLTINGWPGLKPETPSSRYATRYYNATTTELGTTIYQVGKTGDATKEIYYGAGDFGWNSDYLSFLSIYNPFFIRSGGYRSGSNAGVFFSGRSYGDGKIDFGYRTVLCPGS